MKDSIQKKLDTLTFRRVDMPIIHLMLSLYYNQDKSDSFGLKFVNVDVITKLYNWCKM